MMNQLVCPKCFQECEAPKYSCQNPECSLMDKPQDVPQGEAAGRPGMPDLPANCQECGKPLTLKVCPHCDFPLHIVQRGTPSLPVIITGASGCGKSNYLSVLIHRIKQELCKVCDCALYPLGGDATIRLYEQLYYKPLFVQGRCPDSTELEDVSPLGYSLVFNSSAGKNCNLTFYDSCGATFESEKGVMRHNRGLPSSKGILLLIDPSQLPTVQDQLRAQGKPVLEADASALLARIIQMLRGTSGLNNMNRKIQIPLAICLTKLDTVEHMLDPSSFVKHPPRHLRKPWVDKIDLESCDLEVQSLIESWAGKDLINQVRTQFEHSCFFAMSSLGGEPEDSYKVQRVLPHRVLDPLLWLLNVNQIIDCKAS